MGRCGERIIRVHEERHSPRVDHRWVQPHVWAEVTRYVLAGTRGPRPEKAYWLAGDSARAGTLFPDAVANRGPTASITLAGVARMASSPPASRFPRSAV